MNSRWIEKDSRHLFEDQIVSSLGYAMLYLGLERGKYPEKYVE